MSPLRYETSISQATTRGFLHILGGFLLASYPAGEHHGGPVLPGVQQALCGQGPPGYVCCRGLGAVCVCAYICMCVHIHIERERAEPDVGIEPGMSLHIYIYVYIYMYIYGFAWLS